MKYQVRLTEQVITTLVVEADSKNKALTLARCHQLEWLDSMEWIEESVVVKSMTEPVVVAERPLLEVELC